MTTNEPTEKKAAKTLGQRMDHGFAELNAFLMVLAIGLAILDTTCFTALKLGEAYVNSPAVALSASSAKAALVQ